MASPATIKAAVYTVEGTASEGCGLQAAKRKVRGYRRFDAARMLIFLLAGKLDFSQINPHAHARP